MKSLHRLPALILAGAITSLLPLSARADDITVLDTHVEDTVAGAVQRAPECVLPRGFHAESLAEGTDPIENPSGLITRFGYLNNGPLTPASGTTTEAQKTEPDENTYLVFPTNPGGPTPGYDYGRHFLYQGHENASDLAYVTRINLDVEDPAHRITLLTPVGADGKTHFNRIDGSTWNPHTQSLFFTQEDSNVGGVIEISAAWPPVVTTHYGIIGVGGYEGIHPDDQGNLLIVEDAGGTSVNIDPANAASPKLARNPNSFVYRFVPNDIHHISAGGKLQALQVSIEGSPLGFVPVNAANPTGDVFSDNQLKLHKLGTHWPVRWVTIHDTAVQGITSFNANAAAKAAGATPFKRPENAIFKPATGFRTFFFTATGDTNATTGTVPALVERGTWGSVFRVDLAADRETGTISIFTRGDADHASFDNLCFADDETLLVGEDRGDTLHGQLNALDSLWAYSTRKINGESVRLVAEGRDPSAETDSVLARISAPGFTNDGDNEVTGVHCSDGDPTVAGLLGARHVPRAGVSRVFFTQQHGDNVVWEIFGKRDQREVKARR